MRIISDCIIKARKILSGKFWKTKNKEVFYETLALMYGIALCGAKKDMLSICRALPNLCKVCASERKERLAFKLPSAAKLMQSLRKRGQRKSRFLFAERSQTYAKVMQWRRKSK